jgi:hypothetical protein
MRVVCHERDQATTADLAAPDKCFYALSKEKPGFPRRWSGFDHTACGARSLK